MHSRQHRQQRRQARSKLRRWDRCASHMTNLVRALSFEGTNFSLQTRFLEQ